MKLVIDIEPRYCEDMQSDVKELYYEAINRITEAVRNGIPYEDKPRGDFISREALKKALHNFFDGKVIGEPAYILRDVFCYIDGAPALAKIDTNDIEYKSYCKGLEDGKKIVKTPSEWIRREDVIHLLERWSDGYSYIEIPTDDALKAIKEMEGGTHGQ